MSAKTKSTEATPIISDTAAAAAHPAVGDLLKQSVQLKSGQKREIRVRVLKTRSQDPDEA